MRRAGLVSVLLALVVFVSGCGSDSTSGRAATTSAPATTTASSPTTTVAVQKDVLNSQVDPPGAQGRTLTLIRYTIAPGAKLAAHIHPGVQMASIQSGSLAYTVISGTASVRRAPAGTTEQVTGPADITLNQGDSVIEKGDMVHFGANTTATPVVIVATLLTEDGQDLAVPVTTTVPTSTPG